jgi:hypothetical protein
MGAKAGPKGKSGEYEVRDLLTGWGHEVGIALDLSRNLLQVREGGADIDGVVGLEIEVKRVEANGINQWWAQVCKAADKSGKVPMLAHRRNRQPWRFRVRTTVALHDEYSNRWKLFPVVVDLELIEAKQWFQNYLEVFQ